MITSIIIGVWIALFVAYYVFKITRMVALDSSSTKLKWLRKFFWREARGLIMKGYIGNWKVESYFARYLKNSVAAKQHFINNGLAETRHILVGKIEELQRFVEKYKYNSFDNLDMDEEDFINSFEKKHKK